MQQVLSGKTLEKAKELAHGGHVHRLGDGTWAVEAATLWVGAYVVTRNGHGYACECKSFAYRHDCAHVRAVAITEGDDAWAAFEPEKGGGSRCYKCGEPTSLVLDGRPVCDWHVLRC